MTISVDIKLDDRELLRSLPTGQPEATIESPARTHTGLSIFRLIDKGRGPVVARNAKALRFRPRRGGRFIFRKRVGPAPAQNITAKAVAATLSAVPAIAATQENPPLSTRRGLVSFLNRVAQNALQNIKVRIRGTGKLAANLRITRAK